MFNQYWDRLKFHNATLRESEDTKIVLTITELKRVLEKSFDAGKKDREEYYKALARLRSQNTGIDFSSLFGQVG